MQCMLEKLSKYIYQVFLFIPGNCLELKYDSAPEGNWSFAQIE
jgi:hypothetical protein